MRAKLKNLRLRMALIGLCSFAIMFGFTTSSVLAEDDKLNYEEYKKKEAEMQLSPHERPYKAEPPKGGHSNLAGAATNPIANLIQFQMQDQYSPSSHNADGYSNVAIIQPVVPFKLPWEKVPLLVTRTTLPYITTPKPDSGIGRHKGFGDIVAQGYFLPKLETKGVSVGLGYNLTIPSAGDNEFVGSGKWSLGPGLVFVNMQTPSWLWGILSYSSFSFADSDSDRSYVSNISIQPVLVKHFSKGWYAAVPDVPQTYNFRTDLWTLNIGPRVGRVMKFGKQPVNLFGQVTYNPIDYNDQVSSEWTFKINLTLLFPK